MSHDTLLAEILRLPLAERYALLLDMLEHQKANETDELDHAIYAEVKRRCTMIAAGQVSFGPWTRDNARVLEPNE